MSPGVEDGEKAYFRAKMFWISRDGVEGFSDTTEKDAVDDLLVLQCQGPEVVLKREHRVIIFNGVQHLGGASFEPFGSCRTLAFWAVAVSAGIVEDVGVSTLAAFLDMSAEGRGTACHDVSQNP